MAAKADVLTETIDGKDCIVKTDNTKSKLRGLKPFKSGAEWTGNAKGRPRGSRNRVSTEFYNDVYHLWLEQGNSALRDMLAESPTKFCQMVAQVLPKHVEVDATDGAKWVINASAALTVEDWQASLDKPDKETPAEPG